jgi:enoyl-[acyl-carrier protein] reductase I
MAHLAEPLMKKGGTLFTMTYYGSQSPACTLPMPL